MITNNDSVYVLYVFAAEWLFICLVNIQETCKGSFDCILEEIETSVFILVKEVEYLWFNMILENIIITLTQE